MVNKCAVFGCKRGYESEEPQHEDYHAFYFPLDERKSHLLPAWEKFVCRDGWKPSANSVICEFHFEDRLIRKGKRWTLKWKLNPMPTMLTDEMMAMPQLLMDYSYNIVQAHGVRDVRAAYTQIFDRFSPQIDICCSKHNNWGLNFAAKIVINTFFNNKQTVSSDSARKDTVVAFKKRQRTK